MNPYSTELAHHGILGQRWGIRRFQNKDGSVTAAGAKRYQKAGVAGGVAGAAIASKRDTNKLKRMEKKYTKEMIKYQKDSMKNRQKLNINAYNKTADEYNNGKIAEFNKKNKTTDPKYMEKYAKQFENDYRKNYDKMMLSEVKNNKHYKKAEALVEKYKDLETTEIVSKNRAFVRDLEKAIDSGKTSWDMDLSKYKQGG